MWSSRSGRPLPRTPSPSGYSAQQQQVPPPPPYSVMSQGGGGGGGDRFSQPPPAPIPPPPSEAPSIESATLKTKVQLRISCTDLANRDHFSKSDPQAYIYFQHVGASSRTRLQRTASVSSIRSDSSSVALRIAPDGRPEVAGGWNLVARTATIQDELNPVFPEIITFDYFFEEVQNVCIVIVDVDNNSGVMTKQQYLGHTTVSLGQIVSAGSRGLTDFLKTDCQLPRGVPGFHDARNEARAVSQQNHRSPAKIMLLATTEADNRRQLVFSFSCTGLPRMDANGLADPYFVLSRIDRSGHQMHVYRSPIIRRTLSPAWRDLRVPLRLLAPDGVGGAADRVRVSVWDWDRTGGDDYIGSVDTSVGGLLAAASSRTPLQLVDAAKTRGVRKMFYHGSGTLRIDACAVVDEPQFLDFVAAGAQIDLAVAVDLTASNQYPHHPTSLHHFPELVGRRGSALGVPQPAAQEGSMNEYQRAIVGVGQILQEYDSDKIFPMYGFGYEKPPGVRHRCGFFGRAFGVQGLLEMYHDTVCDPLLRLSGPTDFAPVIDQVSRDLEEKMRAEPSMLHYQVLLMVTDGLITDLDATLRSLTRAASLPLSIVVVGVGQEDFGTMNILDADDGDDAATWRLRPDGRGSVRDIVQFVPMREVGADPFALARETLAEIPDQFMQYVRERGIRLEA
ncbi:Copine-8 [Cladochytrium tenue]|nr:Copine-8 [Cladochytrium tenue]